MDTIFLPIATQTKVRLLFNDHPQNHSSVMQDLFANADEIWASVAFFKKSGWTIIEEVLSATANLPGKKYHFYIGLSMGFTEPKALLLLYGIIGSNANHQIVLCDPPAGVFHPKIYMFRKGSQVTAVIGSANMTEGGWLVNDEVSFLVETTVSSREFTDVIKYLGKLSKDYRSTDVLAEIHDYQEQLAAFRKHHGTPKKFRFRRPYTTPSVYNINYGFLRTYLDAYNASELKVIPERREQEYEQARQLLEEIRRGDWETNQAFKDLFGPLVGQKGYEKLWHSGSVHRHSYKTLDHPTEFRELVESIAANKDKPASETFDAALSLHKEIPGVGRNIVTEIMMTYNWDDFPNLNNNPITVLREAGYEAPDVSQMNGPSYLEYSKVLKEIRRELGLANMLEVDSFFNYIYWILMEEIAS